MGFVLTAEQVNFHVTPATLPLIMPALVDHLSGRHPQQQQPPEVIAIRQIWKPSLLRCRVEAVEYAQNGVFFI